MAKFSIAPAQIPRTAGEGTLISSGITGVVSAYTKPGEGLGHRAGVLRGPIQDPACGLRRILLPRTPVNKGKKKGRGVEAPILPPPPARCAPFLERRSSTSRRTLQGGPSQRVHLSLRGLSADR